MKINFLLVTLIIIIVSASSCSSSYKTTQTPDDVYYSPLRLQTDNVKRDEQKNVYDNSASTTEDREVRVRVHNRRYRRYDDRYDYPYGYGNNYPYNDYPVYGNPKYGSTQNPSQPRKTNLGAYKPNTTTPDSTVIFNPKLGNQNTGNTTVPIRTFGKPSNNGSGVGNFIRKVFNGDNNSSNNNYNSGNYNNNSSPSRTFENTNTNSSTNNTNSSSSTNSNSSSTKTPSTSAPVRTFGKDN
jgi:hypothetical protein